jgi:hypothetical protein
LPGDLLVDRREDLVVGDRPVGEVSRVEGLAHVPANLPRQRVVQVLEAEMVGVEVDQVVELERRPALPREARMAPEDRLGAGDHLGQQRAVDHDQRVAQR